MYRVFSVKATFMGSIILFEAGSALCGAAPTSDAFIVGRAIAGLGSGGVMSGVVSNISIPSPLAYSPLPPLSPLTHSPILYVAVVSVGGQKLANTGIKICQLVVVVYTLPLQQRPKFQGFFGAVFGLASVGGPLIGGAFTTNVTWRWCFYINLPLGAVAMVFVFFLLKIPDREETRAPLREKLRQLNALGLVALLPGVVCLCLALQWGGTVYSVSPVLDHPSKSVRKRVLCCCLG